MRNPLYSTLSALIVSVLGLPGAATAKSEKGIHFSPFVWGGYGNVRIAHTNAGYFELEGRKGNSYGGGIMTGYNYSDHAGFYMGIGFSHIGWKAFAEHYYGQGLYQSVRTRQRMIYLEVPAYLRFTTGKPARPGFTAELGFVFGLLQSAHFWATETGGYAVSYYGVDNKKTFRKAGISTHTFLGANIPAGRRVSVLAGPEFRYQLTELFDDSSPYEGGLYSFGLRLGISLKTSGAKASADRPD